MFGWFESPYAPNLGPCGDEISIPKKNLNYQIFGGSISNCCKDYDLSHHNPHFSKNSYVF